METKTLLKIENDYFSNMSEFYFNESIQFYLSEINVFCEISNTSFINPVEKNQKTTQNKKDFDSKITIEAKGYCQSEWQTYTLYYHKSDSKKQAFKDLIFELKKSFTHKNDYVATKYEYTKINGSIFINEETQDTIGFSINHIEFPTKEEIKNNYIDLYGKDFDRIEILTN